MPKKLYITPPTQTKITSVCFMTFDKPRRAGHQSAIPRRLNANQKLSDQAMKVETDEADAFLSPQDRYIKRYKALNEALNVNKKGKFKRPGGLPLTDEEGHIIRIKNGSRFFTTKIYTASMEKQEKPSAVLYPSQTEEEFTTEDEFTREERSCPCALL